MYYSQRYQQILNILKNRNSASVQLLSKKLFVSEPTIRRDLKVLESEGKIKRTYGGAIISSLISDELPLVMREHENIEAKYNISLQAKNYISDGQVIFLDASSTVYFLLQHLSSFTDLKIVTNSPKAPLKLSENKVDCISTGGILLNHSLAYVGKFAKENIEKFNADIFFFSCRGLNMDGMITDSSIEESDIRQTMLKHSKKNILLCTSNKIGKQYMYNLCNISEIDEVICDIELPDMLKGKLNNH